MSILLVITSTISTAFIQKSGWDCFCLGVKHALIGRDVANAPMRLSREHENIASSVSVCRHCCFLAAVPVSCMHETFLIAVLTACGRVFFFARYILEARR